MNKKKSLPALIVAALLLAGLPLAHAELPLITDARIPATPPGSEVAAGYLTLTNSADEPLVVQGASSTSVPRVELHLTEIKDDVASMTKQGDITVAAGETLVLDHGGYHLMLMGLEAPLAAGDVIDLTLATSAGEVELSMPVIEPGSHGAAMEQEGTDHDATESDNMNKETDHDSMGHGTKEN